MKKERLSKELLQKAVEAIHQKECVVFPTETVYGLGANALCKDSVLKIFQLKNRPPTNPLIVHVPNIQECLSVASGLTSLEQKLLETFSPGPLSLILPKLSHVPFEVSGGLDTVGVRIPNHPIALEFLNAVKLPICAPSANISGKPSPTTFEMAKFYMEDKVPVILDGGMLDIGIESTVLKVENDQIFILRAGFITSEMIKEQIGISPISNISVEHHSPGTRFAHYKPQAKIILFESSDDLPSPHSNSAILFLSHYINTLNYDYIVPFSSVQEYSHNLYHTFFQCDKKHITHIYCELPQNQHQGVALRDRLMKAAE